MTHWEPLPGETPIDDFSELKIRGITTRGELNAAEVENITEAIKKYFDAGLTRRKAPFDYAWALRLHREMFGQVWRWAGVTRTVNLNIGVPWEQVETQLFDLLQNLPYWKDVPWLTQAALLHHGAVRIHPFKNGNGRWSRLLANIWLRLHQQPYTHWPEAAVGSSESAVRGEYLAAIKAADDGDIDPLVELHRRFTPP